MTGDSPGARRSLFSAAQSVTVTPDLLAQVTPALQKTTQFLRERQAAEGYWVAELEGDSILESEYLLLLAFLGQLETDRARRAAESLRQQQLSTGGWAAFPGGPVEISGSVKAYLALKLMGDDPQSEPMQRAREAIRATGGAEKINSFTRYYLAMLGIIPYQLCPAVPPEVILLPTWAPFNIYEMSAWSRTIIVPLSLLWAYQPVTPQGTRGRIDELYTSAERCLPRYIRGVNHESSTRGIDWTWVFQRVDDTLKWCEARGIKPLRSRALARCEAWILERLEGSDGLGAIFPPIIWTIIGLKCRGYAVDSPEIQQQFAELEKLVVCDNAADPTQVWLQPCLSPVWDTAIALIALRDADVPSSDPMIQRGVSWLLSKEIRRKGDWSLSRPKIEPGGWAFEFNNEFYPDNDDTSMVLMALARCCPEAVDGTLASPWRIELSHSANGHPQSIVAGQSANSVQALAELEHLEPLRQAMQRGARWLRSMQSRDGGWGAFDADNTRELFTKVPFADHNAMIDPSTSDITARVLESFAHVGIDQRPDWVLRALQFIWKDQQPDHAWFGRWGVNYIYGTWQVLQGLVRLGIPATDGRLQRAADWLVSKQQPCGGWGETPATYDDPTLRGTGQPTASQTAWAVLGLIAAGRAESLPVQRGVEYLLSRQQPDGSWVESEFTGTGFPRVFYLRYHYYRIYFPLMALGRYRQVMSSRRAMQELPTRAR
jgi:squalene-hopene/tetraprenyl-beta-curcumene cyclase